MYCFFLLQLIRVYSNYTLNFSQATDNGKLAQLYAVGQLIAYENQIQVSEAEQKEDADFAYQIWYNLNYTMKNTTGMWIPSQSIKPESYKDDIVPGQGENNTKFKNYFDEWKNQTDEDKSIILQSLCEKIFEQILTNVPVEERVFYFNQTEMIEENIQRKNMKCKSCIDPIPWQRSQMPQDQYTLSRFVAKSYQKKISIEEVFKSLPIDEQKLINQTFCNFFGIETETIKNNTVGISPETGSPSDPQIPTDPKNPSDPKSTTDPKTPSDPTTPADPKTATDPKTPTDLKTSTDPKTPTDLKASQVPNVQQSEEGKVFLYAFGLVFSMILLLYLAFKIKDILRKRSEEDKSRPNLQINEAMEV